MMNGWYFNEELSPSDDLVDKFADSKFGIDRWKSFTREIIQNSLDAQYDKNKPVEVVFDLNKELSLVDIPDGMYTRDVLRKCEELATNPQTKKAYEKGLSILNKDKIYCMKVSDFNTCGVKSGRDEAWGALVFDEGRSVKLRPGSAGSHGVGKKVPFIISSCNTVFYATKNKYIVDENEISDKLVQGKTMLIGWTDDEGKRRSYRGWYGKIDNECLDCRNKITPLVNDEIYGINPYFVRDNECGTDVIIVGVNIYDSEEEIKKYMISAIMENFFVAIKNKNLVVTVFGEEINECNIDKLYNRFYCSSDKNQGNELCDCLRVYSGEATQILKLYDKKGELLGNIDVYFGLDNSKNRKYYTIVREHGMRIKDNRINSSDQPYTAVVVVRGERINELLSSLENAAHDDFIVKDENMELDEEAVSAYNLMQNAIKDYILEMTKIYDEEGQSIEGLSNIINIPGEISNLKKKNNKPRLEKRKILKNDKGQPSKDYKNGKGKIGGGKKQKRKKGKGNKPAEKGETLDSILYEDYITEPICLKGNKEYSIMFSVNDDIWNAEVKIRSINSDEKSDNSIGDFIDYISDGTQKYKFENGKIKGVKLKKGTQNCFKILLKKDITYKIKIEIYYKEVKINE